MSGQPVPSSHPFVLKLLSGTERGVEYRLVSQQVTIGRADGNTIVIDDQKVSRKHLVVFQTPEGIQIQNVSNGNSLNINGTDIENAIVPAGSIIKFGNTKMELVDERAMTKPKKNSPIASQSAGLGGLEQNFPQAKAGSGNRLPIYVGFGLLLFVAVLLMTSDGSKDEDPAIKSQTLQQEEIDRVQERKNALYRARQAQGKDTPEYREAQALYIQGFRDYREGNYNRAMDYFNGALSLHPQHALARRYLNQSKTKLDELIQLTLLEANRHYEKKQYRQASSKYKQVLIFINDKNNPTYKEAYARYSETLLLIRSVY